MSEQMRQPPNDPGPPSEELSEDDLKELRKGIDQFNRQEFFQSHETLERIWLSQTGDNKELLQGLIQLAVAYHHMLNGNKKGAIKLLNRGLARVVKYEPSSFGLALSDLCQAVRLNAQQLESFTDTQGTAPSIPRVRFL